MQQTSFETYAPKRIRSSGEEFRVRPSPILVTNGVLYPVSQHRRKQCVKAGWLSSEIFYHLFLYILYFTIVIYDARYHRRRDLASKIYS